MIRLERVVRDNWKEVIKLDIADEQRRFLETPSVLHSVAEGQFHPTYTSHAVCDDETIVGFIAYGYLPEEPTKWWIPLIIIDHRYQGKGYGRGALTAVIQAVREQAPDATEIGLSYNPTNAVAEGLYLSLGFEKTDEIDDRGQVTMRKQLKG